VFNKLNEFLSDLSTRNIFDDQALTELADMARDAVSDISPYGLNYNQVLKDRVKTSMEILKDAIADSIEELPKRKLRVALAA
jgi:hypothetical protein